MIIVNLSEAVISYYDIPGYYITIIQNNIGEVKEIEIVQTEIVEHND